MIHLVFLVKLQKQFRHDSDVNFRLRFLDPLISLCTT